MRDKRLVAAFRFVRYNRRAGIGGPWLPKDVSLVDVIPAPIALPDNDYCAKLTMLTFAGIAVLVMVIGASAGHFVPFRI